MYYLCRDHGGPWQRDKERNDHLPSDEAMELTKKSYISIIESGFQLLMIDVKILIKQVRLFRLIQYLNSELIEFCEQEERKRNIGRNRL